MSPAEALPIPDRSSLSLVETEMRELGPLSTRGKWAVVIFALIFAWGFAAFIYQLVRGLAVTAMNDYFSWGVYIINFVFFIGISMAGSLISAILRLTGAEWRKPITRMAEAITVFALIVAAFMIVVDMGRPDRFLYTLWYARVQSPILWDVFSLTTYLVGSALYLYLPLIPDFAALGKMETRFPRWRRRIYSVLSLGWSGTREQHQRLERAISVMAVVIIPVAISIHTVTAWLFGMTLRPGWHSTIIGPDFVVGALYSGIAAVITMMAVLRWVYHLERFITVEHFKKLALLMLVSCVSYLYFVANEYISAVYTNDASEQGLLDAIFSGHFSVQFWTMLWLGLVAPGVLLLLPWTRNIGGIVTAAVLVNIGMWLKRFIIVVPTLYSTLLPPELLPPGKPFGYWPTWVEWALTAGGFACFALFYIVFSKFVPIISLWEMQEVTEPSKENTSRRVAASPTGAKASATAALLALAFVIGGKPASALADEATSPPGASISLKLETEDGKQMIVATVLADGKPKADAKVVFEVPRAFGALVIGEDTTLDDGSAATPFPADLPAGVDGRLVVNAHVQEPAELAAVRAHAEFEGALKSKPETNAFSRALWAPRAPVALLITLGALLGAFWSAFGYAGFQLFRIWKSKPTSQP